MGLVSSRFTDSQITMFQDSSDTELSDRTAQWEQSTAQHSIAQNRNDSKCSNYNKVLLHSTRMPTKTIGK